MHQGALYFVIDISKFNSAGAYSLTSQEYVSPQHEDLEFPAMAAGGNGGAIITFTLSGNGGPTGAYYGKDVQRFIAISARIGAIIALANLVLLVTLGIDFPVLCCVLYFVLQFIPSIGFLIAMVPPALLALLTFGWKRALFVIIGLAVTQMASDYILQPTLMKKSMHISLLEIMLALMIWGFLLGPPGTILGVPLTIALKKYIQQPYTDSDPVAPEPAPTNTST